MKDIRSTTLRCTGIFGALAIALALVPAARAGVRVGFNVNIALPSGVHVSAGNYEPYYVGRVYYEPLHAWRPVYSFPVQTPYGMEYRPYVYDGDRVVCRDYIPGRSHGYSGFVLEGRGHYDPQWRHDSWARRHEVRDSRHHQQDHAWNHRDHGSRGRHDDEGRDHSRNQGKQKHNKHRRH